VAGAAVEQEQLRVGPHVARVRRDEKREVADQAHVLGTGVRFQTRPLTEDQELREPNLLDLVRQISSARSSAAGVRRTSSSGHCR
jgi:hypothetical protein